MFSLILTKSRFHFTSIVVPINPLGRGEFTMSSANTSSIATPGGMSTGDRILAALQTLGRSLMLPIAVMPAAALLLRFGQPDMLQLVGLTQQQLPWLGAAGNAIFGNLPIIFAI